MRKKRKSNSENLGEAIDRLFSAYGIEDKIYEAKLVQAWEKMLGPVVAKHTIKLTLLNNKLYVRLDSATLRNELNFAKTKLISKLNKEVDKKIIKEIVFK